MLQSKVSDFSGAGEQIRTSVEDIFEALLPKIQELKASSALIKNINDENNAKMLRANELMIDFHDRVSKNIDQINESVGAQTERLESVAEKALESAGSLRDTIERDIRNIEETLKNHQELSLIHISEPTRH